MRAKQNADLDGSKHQVCRGGPQTAASIALTIACAISWYSPRHILERLYSGLSMMLRNSLNCFLVRKPETTKPEVLPLFSTACTLNVTPLYLGMSLLLWQTAK